MKFCEKLKKAIDELGLNRSQVCDLTGKSKGSVSQYLSGKQIPSEEVQSEIATALGLESDYFSNPKQKAEVQPAFDLKDGVIPRLHVKTVAKLMRVKESTIRDGLIQKKYDWGYAVQTSENRYSYFINAIKFQEIERVKVEGLWY